MQTKKQTIFLQLQKRMHGLINRVNKINKQLFDVEKEKVEEDDKRQAELARKQIDALYKE